MKTSRTALFLAILMAGVSVAGVVARPDKKAGDVGNSIQLDSEVPRQFGEWTELSNSSAQVINPQVKAYIDVLYSQVLTRTYVNKSGYRIMLSMAYGDDQRGGMQAHRPEVCYPAQGFKLERTETIALATPFGSIDARRLNTSLGERVEPVTYWLTVGDQVVNNDWQKRLAQARLFFTGQIPDGLLYRVSSIDRDSAHAFAVQQKFVTDMMSAVPAKTRKRLGAPEQNGLS